MVYIIDYVNIRIHTDEMNANDAIPLQLNTVKRLIKYGAVGYIDDEDLKSHLNYLLNGKMINHDYLPRLEEDDPIIMVYKDVANIAEFVSIIGNKQLKQKTDDFQVVKFYLLG